jgi:hypothetical protein
MPKFVHIVQVHPVENGWANLSKVVLEKEFETKDQAENFMLVFNVNGGTNRHGDKTIASYLGCVNDETGELL